jgi:hypothetical protein
MQRYAPGVRVEQQGQAVTAFHDGSLPLGERSPLFGRRGLFRH